MRQHLIELFQTSEVTLIPNATRQFLIRDTNGAVWFMRADNTSEAGTVMLFPGRSNQWTLPASLRPAAKPLTNGVILEDK